MTSNSNGWDDEAASMKGPSLYRCRACGGALYRGQVTEKRTNGGSMAVFYCSDCIKNLRYGDCPFVAYDDPGQWVYLCINCPIPEMVCDLRSKTPLKVV